MFTHVDKKQPRHNQTTRDTTQRTPWGARLLRALGGIGAIAFTALALLAVLHRIRYGIDPLGIIFGSSVFAVPATMCWWLALRGHRAESRAHLGYALAGGLILGGASFAAGFFGPLILTPEANQGPLAGFILGPIGSFFQQPHTKYAAA
jgi:hypothetical protein